MTDEVRPRPAALKRRAALLLGPSLAACGPLERGAPVPPGQVQRATVLGIHHERFTLDAAGIRAMDEEFTRARLGAFAARQSGTAVVRERTHLLAVSGGGEDGAFGAGLLTGWTLAGNRPEFALVTGVSTGALTAPFAFLGPEWDAALRSVYTDITLRDVAVQRSILAAVTHDGMADTTPLFGTISRHLDEAMLTAIAAAYRRGRLLLIGTTNLDAQRQVIWNVGAIAASGHPDALDLIRRLLLASAAIPGAFPPVMIDVWVDGERRQEMHVDGGAVAQAFLYPAVLAAGRRAELRAGRPVAPVSAYVIRNAKLAPNEERVDRRTITIAGKAVGVMLASSGINDINRMYLNTERDGIAFNLAYIGADFTTPWPAPFDQAYMRALFDYAHTKARAGYPWESRPPWEQIEPPSWQPGARRGR